MAKIDVTRYSEDKSCVEPEGLRAKYLADLLPTMKKMKLQRNRCIVATYIQTAMTKGGIIRPFTSQEEDRWQGKVGLLLAVGPSAFDFEEVRDAVAREVDFARECADGNGVIFTEADEETAQLTALRAMGVPEVGDWVAYRTSETHEIGVPVDGEHTLASCRLITDDSIAMVLADPRIIY